MTLLVASIAPTTLSELGALASRAWAGGAEAVELRIDTFTEDPTGLAAYLKRNHARTWIITCRSEAEGGGFRGTLEERVARLAAAASDTTALIDFELADWKRSGEARAILRKALGRDEPHRRLILSAHDVGDGFAHGPTSQPSADAADATGSADESARRATLRAIIDDANGVAETAVVKVAYTSSHIGDTFDALDALHDRPAPSPSTKPTPAITAIAMGEAGLWTRVLAKKLGAFATYCALETSAATAPGQVTLREMVERYRWADINADTKVFGVVGDPIAHSLSPLLMNHWFAEEAINAVYLPLLVGRQSHGLRGFLDRCRQREWLDLAGLSVTIPHKTTALEWIGDGGDHMARKIGALNTISFRSGGAQGFNTDCHAAISSICDALGCERRDLPGVRVDVLGTGGAAMAVLYGLPMFGCHVTLYGRTEEKTKRMADAYSVTPAPWEARAKRTGDVVINCTSVGMWPEIKASPLPPGSLAGCRLVFDMIYNPLETHLLKDAAAAGAKALSGLDMFVRQAAVQFELWTGRSRDTAVALDWIQREIKPPTEAGA